MKKKFLILCPVVATCAGPALAQNDIAGSLDPSFNTDVSGNYVSAMAVQADGKTVIAGNFSGVSGQTRGGIARLQANGSVESAATFNPGTGANFWTTAAAVQADGKIVIGGAFTTVNGQTRNHIARLLSGGGVESTATFNPGTGLSSVVFNGALSSIAIQADGKILIAGQFTLVNGQSRRGIARLLTNGTLDASFLPGTGAGTGVAGTEANVYCVAVQTDGKVLIGGDFISVNGQSRKGVARLLANGSVESTATFNVSGVGGGVGFDVFSILMQPDGKILIGGNFATVNGQPHSGLARLLPDGTVESTVTFNPGNSGVGIRSMALQADGKIVLGLQSGIVRLLADGTVESTATFNSGATAGTFVFGVALQADGKIMLGGGFTSVDGQTRNHIARLTNDPAVQILTIQDGTRAQWLRRGAAPEVEQVAFEVSTNGGTSWSLLGPGTRIASGWELTGLSLPAAGTLRARGRTTGSASSGSSGMVETVISFPVPVLPVLTITRVNANVIVSWPFPSTDFVLQQNTSLTTSNWTSPPESVTDDATTRSIIVSPTAGSRFYRLLKL